MALMKNPEKWGGRVDLHLHSRHSDKPSTAFHKWLNAGECHTSVEDIYRMAKARGMSLVTITDHDCIDGALELQALHPGDTFVSCEVTASFPQDGCKVHVLVWGVSQAQYREIDRARQDLNALVEYLRRERIPHGLAHPTYPVNARLTPSHLERLVLLFDVFEGINGGRSQGSNEAWTDYLSHLDAARMDELRRRHGLDSASGDSWVKTLIGGSDDHAGAFIGRTWTSYHGQGPVGLFASLANKATGCGGEHGNVMAYAFGAMQVAHGFASNGRGSYLESAIGQAAHYFFTNQKLSWAGKFRLGKWRDRLSQKGSVVNQALVRLLDVLKAEHGKPVAEKLESSHGALYELADALMLRVFQALGSDLRKGNIPGCLKHLGSLFPNLMLLAPFLASGFHLYRGDRGILEAVRAATPVKRKRRVLWFTDTLEDLNGVSETLKSLAWMAHGDDRELKLVACLGGRSRQGLPPNLIDLPYIKEFGLPFYEKQKVRIPSLLKSLHLLEAEEPDLVILSTPGPLGMLGLLFARMMGIPAHGVYHTDFSFQLRQIAEDDGLADLVEAGQRWFYGQCEVLRVPTRAYMKILTERGYAPQRMKPFRRGLDSAAFAPMEGARERMKLTYDLQGGTNLVYTGRVSLDKNMPFLADLYERMAHERDDLNLLVAGDGPWLSEMRQRLEGHARVRFTGRLPREALPLIYAGSDLLLFPSDTDTFGMTVFEAQACGLPAIVSDLGGPQEIIEHGHTGWVAKALNMVDWTARINEALDRRQANPEDWQVIRDAARARVVAHHDFRRVLDELMGQGTEPENAAWLGEAAPVTTPG